MKNQITEEMMIKWRWTQLITLILLIGVMVTVIAATGKDTPSLTVTPVQEPELTLTNHVVLEPAETKVGTAPKADSKAGAIEAINSEPLSWDSSMDQAGFSNDSPSFPAQVAGIEGDLTVSVNGSVTAEADEAYVVVVPPTIYGPSGIPQPISSEDRAAVIEKLVGIGVARENIELESQGIYSPFGVSAEVQVSELPQVGQLILDAVEEVIGRSESHGVRFSLSQEECDQALALARREAVPQANKAAADLAQALDIERGSVIGATEGLPQYLAFTPMNPHSCGHGFQDPFVLAPFDAEPQLEVTVSLQVIYTIEPPVKPAIEP